MATSIFGLTFNINSDTAFRSFGSTLSTQLSTLFTKVTTSNDIDWDTVILPPTGTYPTTFEVYRFNDTLQTNFPIFIKFEYSSNYSAVVIRATIGKSCDAAGTISGILLPATVIISNSSTNTTPQTCYISNGDGSSLCLALAPTVTQIGGLFIIERAFNNNGTLNGDGLWVSYRPSTSGSSTTSHTNYMIAYTAGTSNVVAGGAVGGIFPIPLNLAPGQGLANGNVTPYFPAACLAPNGLYWLPRAGLGGSRAECTAGTIINNLLDNHNYLGIGQLGSHSDLRCNNEASMLIRWD